MADKVKNAKPAKKSAAQMPSKKTMNFVHHQSSINLKKLVPVLLVICIAAALFAKFGFIDPLAKKTAAYNELTLKQEQLAAINTKLAGYDELALEYGRYSYGWMNDTEVNMVSRMDVLNLIEKEISSKAIIDNMAVNNNVLTLNIHGITLEQASTMVKSLEQQGLVESAAVYNAVAEEAEEAKIFMSIILTKEAE
jgi:hypothetical protein